MVFKVVISDPKSRKAYQKEAEEGASGLVGKKIGEKVSGSFLGMDGYELEITGGSDRQGFPMRPDVEGQGRKRIILSYPPGFHAIRKGGRKRKSVRGNTVSNEISQINVKVVKMGKKSLGELFGAKGKPEGEAKGEKPKEGKAKPEEKKEASKETKAPKEERKEKPAEKREGEAKPEGKSAEEKMGIKTLEDREKEVKEEVEKGEPARKGGGSKQVRGLGEIEASRQSEAGARPLTGKPAEKGKKAEEKKK